MSLIDKLTGRAKKAAGDLTGDSKLRRQGAREERKAKTLGALLIRADPCPRIHPLPITG